MLGIPSADELSKAFAPIIANAEDHLIDRFKNEILPGIEARYEAKLAQALQALASSMKPPTP